MHVSARWKIAQWLEIRWWKRYLAGQDVEEYLSWKRKYWNKLLNSIQDQVSLADNMNLLDAGCGPAGVFMVLDQYQVDAVDPLLTKYDRLHHFDRYSYPWVNFTNKALEEVELYEMKYDVIFCMNAINHVSDIEKSISQLYKFLKPKGKLVLSTDSHRSELLKHLFRSVPGDALHPHQYNAEEYEELLARAGFGILSSVVVKPGKVFNYQLIVATRN